jgi:short-subunit dehydrogenase
MLKPEDVAQATVDAILNKTSVISVPFSLQFGINLFNILPFWFQHFIRDYLRGESTFLIKKC